jgi:hypothetical protein
MFATLAFLRHELAFDCIEPTPRTGVNGRVRGQEGCLHIKNHRLGDIRVPHIRLHCFTVWSYTQCLSNGRVREAQPLN